MAGITINIRALDLTQNAVKSALDALRKLSTESEKMAGSANATRAFNRMSQGAKRFELKSIASLKKVVQQNRRSLQLMTAMEARYSLHLLQNLSKRQAKETRYRRRRVQILKRIIQQELGLANRTIRSKERKERDAARESIRRQKRVAKATMAARRTAERAAQQYLKAQERREKEAERRTYQRLQRMKKRFSDFFGALRNAGFNLIFAGSLFGSTASMFGQGIGGQFEQLGSVLRQGFTGFQDVILKSIRMVTILSQTVVKFVGYATSMFANLTTGIVGSIAAAVPKVGIFLTGLLVGIGNALAGVLRGATEIISGIVNIAGSLLEGAVKTITDLAMAAANTITNLVSSAAGALGSLVGKAGDIAGKTFGKVLGFVTQSITKNLSTIAEFRAALADVFTQTPEIGVEKFKLIQSTIEDIAKTLPLAKTDLAKGLFEIVSTQLTSSPEEALDVLQGVSRATLAGGHETDVFSVSQAATGILSAYNLEAKDTEVTLSKLFKTAILGRFNFKQLSDGIQAVSGIAANFGVSLNDLLASIILASKSLKPREVFVGVKNLVLSLAAPTFEAKRAMDQLGISLKTYSAEENAALGERAKRIGLMEKTISGLERLEKRNHAQRMSLKDLRRALKGLKEEYTLFERGVGTFIGVNQAVSQLAARDFSPEQVRRIIPERRALAAFAAMSSAQDRATEAISAVAEEQGQAIQRAVEIQSQTVVNKLQLMRNNFEAVFDGLFDLLEPSIVGLVDKITSRLKRLPNIFKETFGGAASTARDALSAVALNVVDIAFNAVEWTVKNWSLVVEKFKEVYEVGKTVFKALAILAKAASELIIQAFGGGNFVDRMTDGWDTIKQTATSVWEDIGKIAEGNLDPVMGLIDRVHLAWLDLVDSVRSGIGSILADMQGPINTMLRGLKSSAIELAHPIAAASGVSPEAAATRRESSISTAQATFGNISTRLAQYVNPSSDANINKIIYEEMAAFQERELAKPQQLSGLSPLGKSHVAEAGLERRLTEVLGTIFERAKISGSYSDRQQAMRVGFGEGGAHNLERSLESLSDAIIILKRYGLETVTEQSGLLRGSIVNLTRTVDALNMPAAPEVREQLEQRIADREPVLPMYSLYPGSEGPVFPDAPAVTVNPIVEVPDPPAILVSPVINVPGQDIPTPVSPAVSVSPVINLPEQANTISAFPVMPVPASPAITVNPVIDPPKQTQTLAVENVTIVKPIVDLAGISNALAARPPISIQPTIGVPGIADIVSARESATAEFAAGSLAQIESNTDQMVSQATSGPSLAQPESVFWGKAPTEPGVVAGVAPHPDAAAIDELLKAALASLNAPPEEEEEKKVKKAKPLSKEELKNLRKQMRRNKMRTAFAPFGEIKGPKMGYTPGEPIVDPVTGEVTGFRETPSFLQQPKVDTSKADARQQWRDQQRAEREAERERRRAAKASAESALAQGLAPAPELANVTPAEQEQMLDSQAPESAEESLGKLGEALSAAWAEKKDETKALLDFSEEQINALESVGITSGELANMIVQGTGKVADIVEILINRINELRAEQIDRLRDLEAAAGET